MNTRATSNEEFAAIWRSAAHLEDVAALTGCTKRTCTVRAQRMRAYYYYDLKPFKRGKKRKVGGGLTHRSR